MNKRMSPAHYWLCRAILLLDKLPLPTKWYRYRPLPKRVEWHWKRGIFGTIILVNRGWIHLFAKEYGYRQAVKRSNGQEQDR